MFISSKFNMVGGCTFQMYISSKVNLVTLRLITDQPTAVGLSFCAISRHCLHVTIASLSQRIYNSDQLKNVSAYGPKLNKVKIGFYLFMSSEERFNAITTQSVLWKIHIFSSPEPKAHR